MNRPLILRLAPRSARLSLYYALYRNRRKDWLPLYKDAPLEFAPGLHMTLSPTDEGHGNIAFTGVYELNLSERIARHAREASGGGLMVDVGANYGYFSLLWAAGAPGNRVIAFEASPRNHTGIETNITSNGLSSRIELRKVAAGRAEGTLPFSLGGTEQTGWGGFAQDGSSADVEVPVVTLDENLAAQESIRLLKIDVEGADTWVLYGAEKLIREHRIQNIYFEEHRERMKLLGIEEGEARAFLEKLGYTVQAMSDSASGFVEYYAFPSPAKQ